MMSERKKRKDEEVANQEGFVQDMKGDSARDDFKDREHLLNIFPPELWLLVFDQIPNGDDLESVSNSSLFLRQLLSPKATSFLLPSVLKILFGKYLEDQKLGRFDEIAPLSFNQNGTNIPFQALQECDTGNMGRKNEWLRFRLKLRLVSRVWCNAVDNYFQNHSFHFKLHKRGGSIKAHGWDLMLNQLIRLMEERFGCELYLYSNKENPHNEFLSHFQRSHETTDRNPFLGRNVRLGLGSSSRCELSLKTEIRNILATYGQHVWYCNFDVENGAAFLEDYDGFIDILKLMPNLKAFYLRFSYMNHRGVGEKDSREANVLLNPLPAFEKLQFLSLVNVPEIFCNELIRNNNQVATLLIEPKEVPVLNILRTPLANLTTLLLEITFEQDFQDLVNIPVNWPLTKLRLTMGREYSIEWQEIFNWLSSNWAHTLTSLELMLPMTIRDSLCTKCSTYLLNLPKLKSLKLSMSEVVSLDFLIPTKDSLSILDLRVNIYWDTKIVQKLKELDADDISKDLLGLSDSPRVSNFWKLFSKLEWIHFECCNSMLNNVEKWSRRRENKKSSFSTNDIHDSIMNP